MITLKELLKLIRKKQIDVNEIKFSDYEIIDATNECLRYMNQSLSTKNTDFLEKIKPYRQNAINAEIRDYNDNLPEGELPKDYVDFAKTGIELPEDFLSLASVIRASDGYKMSPVAGGESVPYGAYKIFANKIFMAEDVDVMYRVKILPVKNPDTDEIDLPDFFIDSVAKITGMILNNAETDILMQAVNENINNIIPQRRYKNVKVRMPFIV